MQKRLRLLQTWFLLPYISVSQNILRYCTLVWYWQALHMCRMSPFTHWCKEVCKKISRFYINAPLCFYLCVEEKWMEGWNWIYLDRKSKLTLTRTKCFIFSYFFSFNMILCIKDVLSQVYTMMKILLHFASIPLCFKIHLSWFLSRTACLMSVFYKKFR